MGELIDEDEMPECYGDGPTPECAIDCPYFEECNEIADEEANNDYYKELR